jgi:hypothetical protein
MKEPASAVSVGVDADFFSIFVRSPGFGTEYRSILRVLLVLGQIRGRDLPIATAIFAERLLRRLEIMRENQVRAA